MGLMSTMICTMNRYYNSYFESNLSLQLGYSPFALKSHKQSYCYKYYCTHQTKYEVTVANNNETSNFSVSRSYPYNAN